MLKSLAQQRPIVIFDPKNKEHRELFNIFLRTTSWKNCPYQWAIDDDSLDVVHCINKKLLTYYIGQEFTKKVVKTATKPVASKKNVLKIKDIQKKAQN
jgi:hypothetical protein